MTNGNQSVTLYVTHASSSGPFLKIWGQIDSEKARKVESAIKQLRERFDHGDGAISPMNFPTSESICCAFHEDNYYRAKILKVNPDCTVHVHFIDYGNTDVVTPKDIRLLDHLPYALELLTLPAIAHDFTLTKVMPYNAIWNNDLVGHIRQMLRYKELEAVVTFPDKLLLCLFFNGTDFSEFLLSSKMAVPATPEERQWMMRFFQQSAQSMPHQSIYHQPPTDLSYDNHMNNNYSMRPRMPMRNFSPPKIIQENWRQPPQHQHQPLMTPPRAPLFASQTNQSEQLHGFINPVLEKDSVHYVSVSKFVDGPLVFSVQMENRAQELETLMKNINNHPLQSLSQRADIGTICLARESKNNTIRRAVVSYVGDPRAAKLFYVDYGDSETLSHSRIYEIPPQYVKPLVLSVRFGLSGLSDLIVSKEMKQYFEELVNNKVLTVRIQPEEFHSPLMSFGIFYLDGKNILDLLRETFPDSTVKLPQRQILSVNSRESVQVSYIDACNKFFVQLMDQTPLLTVLEREITEYIKVALHVRGIDTGVKCLARSAVDLQWYRAEILSATDNEVLVYYLDYGNEEKISRSELRSIRKESLMKFPPLAIQCTLIGFDGVEFDEKIYQRFEEAVLNKPLALSVNEVKPSALIVELYDTSVKPIINISAMLRNMSPLDTNINSKPTQWRSEEDSVTASNNQRPKRSALKTQPVLGHQNKAKVKSVKPIREENDKRTSKSQNDPRQQSFDNSFDNQKMGNWQNTQSDDKRFNNQDQKSKSWVTSPPNDRFNRDNSRNERFNNRDRDTNSRFDRNDTNERFESDTNSNNYGGRDRGGRENRGGRGKGQSPTTSSKQFDRNNSMEKESSWSDKDSNASSRGSGRRGGRDAARGSPRNGNSRDLYKPPRSSGFNNRTPTGTRGPYKRPNERNNESNTNAQIDTWNPATVVSPTEKKVDSIIQIPPPNITLGAVKHCEIVYVTSPSEFYVQLCPDNLELNNVMTKIAGVYETGGTILPESSAKIGTCCIAQYSEDCTWYRAVIQSVESTGAIVQFIDYGNTELVTFDKIKVLQEELVKLPTQAIGCKLLAATKNQWDTSELDRFTAIADIKPLEAEFIAQKDNIYEVLIRQVTDEVPKDTYINEEFSDGVNLIEAKEIAKNNRRPVSATVKNRSADYAPLNQKWSEPPIHYGKEEEVIVTWLTNPNSFYCQLTRNQKEFRSMMEDIQKIYADRQPTKETLEVGSSVIAIFADDMALYRAEILEINSCGISVRYVDFGNSATVKSHHVYNVEKRFMILPKQAVHSTMKNIVPPGSTPWPQSDAQEIDKLFSVEKLQCIFHEEKNNQHIVTLMNNGDDLGAIMIKRGIAASDVVLPSSSLPEITDVDTNYPDIQEHLTRVDISKLIGQLLRVKVTNVESVNKFHIQLASAAANEKIIAEFMENNDTKVMPKLSQCEVCLGAGCLVQTNDGWRRAVVINCSQTTGIDVRFIDTGAIDVIPLDRTVALPGELSMQKQAVECSLKDVSLSTDNNEKLKSLINNKEVIIQIDDVQDDRLIVRLFDEAGKKIRITAKETNENISPLLPMPILFSLHRVTVVHIDHSGSIWLKRSADDETDTQLLDELYNHYSVSGKQLDVKPGELCAAHSADESWYRAKIIDKTETGALVHYIDYGNTEEIELQGLKQLEPQFLKQCQLVVETALTVTVKGTPKEQQEILNTHLLNQEFIASIYRLDNKWMAEIMLKSGVKISDKLSDLGLLKGEETTTDVIESENLIVDNKYKVSVCHAESPMQFWIHKLEDSSALDLFQDKLQTEVLNYETISGIPEDKSLCVALYSVDKMWYRAEVIDAGEDIVTLRFIDYGNTDTILDPTSGMKHLPDEMKNIAPYAIKCRLDLIPFGDDWSQESCARFSALTSHDSMDAITIADGNPKRIELFYDGNSVSDILVKENHALKLQANQELIDEVVELELDPRSAFVSHVNSPSEFWVQEEKSVANLELLVDRFLVADMFPKVDTIEEGLLCVAKYPEDMSWYRARIISHSDAGIEVIYVDYGNSAVSTEIRAVPEDVIAIPPLSRKCCLPLPPSIEKWSDEACQEFYVKADEGAIFLLDILEEGETSKVKLTYDGKDVAEELAKLCEKTTTTEVSESTSIPLENLSDTVVINKEISDDIKSTDTTENNVETLAEMAVYVSQVNSPCEFWIQEENCTESLDMIGERLTNVESYEKIDDSEIKEDTMYIAQFPEDLMWYRARVISHGDTGTNVFFIDYGNAAVVANIRKISDDLESITPLSKKCSLILPDGVSQWSDESCQEFFKLVAEGSTKFIMNIVKESETSLVTLTLDNEDVANHLSNLTEKYEPIIEERLPPLGEENSPNVVVSHVVSPGEFWTQAESQISELEIMAEHLANAARFLPLNKLEEGAICAAEFPEDGQWYRAKILCHSESETEVLYIDYGNSAVTSQIRALPEDIIKIPALSNLCALKMPEDIESWSKEACEKFIELVAEGATMFQYEELDGKEPTYVNLKKDGQDVVSILSPLCQVVKQNEEQLVSDIPEVISEPVLDNTKVISEPVPDSPEIISEPVPDSPEIISEPVPDSPDVEVLEYNKEEELDVAIVEQSITVTESILNEKNINEDDVICITDTSLVEIHEISSDKHSTNTSGVDIQTNISETSTFSNLSENFDPMTESTNSTFERIEMKHKNTITESTISIVKPEPITEEAVELGETIPSETLTDKHKSNENEEAQAKNIAVDESKISEEKTFVNSTENDEVLSAPSTIENNPIGEDKVADKLPVEKATGETISCQIELKDEKIIDETVEQSTNLPTTVTDHVQIIDTNETTKATACETIMSIEKIAHATNESENLSTNNTVNGAQLTETQDVIEITQCEEIPKTTTAPTTSITEKIVADPATDQSNSLVNKKDDEVVQ